MTQETPPEKPLVIDTVDYFSRMLTNYNNDPWIGGTYVSCGTTMLAGLRHCTPEQIVNKVLKERAKNDAKLIKEAFVIFSDTDNSCKMGGNALYAYIKEKQLGHIVEFGPRMNPNTGNMIKLWVWEPPHDSLDPRDMYMKVRGKVLIRDRYGPQYVDDDDIRLRDGRFVVYSRGT